MFGNEENTIKDKVENLKESTKSKARYIALGAILGATATIALTRFVTVAPQIRALRAESDSLWNSMSLVYTNQLEMMDILKQQGIIEDVTIKVV